MKKLFALVLFMSFGVQANPICQYSDSDSDGDGWGWENSASCVTQPANVTAGVESAACIDTDGDGWGWDGKNSCLVSNAPHSPAIQASQCIDTDGDGWGWNGVASCLMSPIVATPSTSVGATPSINSPAIYLHEDAQSGQTAILSTQVDTLLISDLERFIKVVCYGEFIGIERKLIKYRDGSTVSYMIHDFYLPEDERQLDRVISELESLTGLTFVQVYDKYTSNIDIYYNTQDQFPLILSHYRSGNAGFFSVSSDAYQNIYSSTILIDKEKSLSVRNHLLREELTQSLGMINDLGDIRESIFYSGWTATNSYHVSDKSIISTLYTSGIPSGSTAADIRNYFNQ